MKTKPFLLATAGSTVDGRTIDEKMLQEMASSYNPKTYGARVNIEHIRGISGEGPFRAYGDVIELSVGEVSVDFNGKAEKRKALFGVLDVTPDAKRLNEAGQKVYPSVEIEPNFGGKGFAYLMGCALTDSPASIATERMQFNRQAPGTLKVDSADPVALEFADAAAPEAAADGFLSRLGALLDGFSAKFVAPAKGEGADPKADDKPAAALDFTQLRTLFEDLGKSFTTEVAALRTELRTEVDALAVKLKTVEAVQEKTPASGFNQRPLATGGAGGERTDC